MLHHIDVHVRDLAAARAFFDTLAPHIGYRPLALDPDFAGYEPASGGRPRFGLILDPGHRSGSMRMAFAVATIAEVDAAAEAARAAGARALEGPGSHPEYGNYYAVFFEDPDGNKYEITRDAAASIS
ncbi:MAG TPA: VOC family protein [Candidatus Cybelea sp.]|jgi:catechol 2,3-dioxygenase-like lactoylglutathione lyase family enzyme|nr:VOC family protein [Candidatus Cybelea sp.]